MKKKFFYIFSIGLPLIVLCLFLVAIHAVPFGINNSFLSDANAYYINYVSYWKRVLTGKESLFYSFTKGIGGNTSALIAYHLLNPFMLLFTFFDIDQFPVVYTIISLLSVSACGFTMYILLDHLRPDCLSNLIFSTSYALMGYNAVNYWQLQWLTGAILFPLIILGIILILNHKSPVLYIISLACSLIMNFYIGYMCTMGAFLIFIVLLLTEWQSDNNAEGETSKDKKIIFGKYILGTIIAGLMSSFIWLPALLSLKGGRASASNLFTFSFKENSKLLSVFAKLFTGMNSIKEMENGLPAIFCGIIPLFLCVLFFVDKKTEKSKKVGAGILLGIYILSFYINTISVVFQGFSYTVWFNFRYSFIFSFLLIMVAFDELQRSENWNSKDLQKTTAILVIAAVLIFSEDLEFAEKPYYLIDFGILALALGALFLYKKRGQHEKKILIVIILLCVGINCYMNQVLSTQELSDWFRSYADTKSGLETKKVLVNYVTGQDSSFYRMESEVNRSDSAAMDPMMFDYNGTSFAGSVEKDFVKKNLIKFGVQWFDNRNYYDSGMAASMDSLLGIKYVLSKRDLTAEKQYQLMNTVMNIGIYKNPYSLSPAVLSGAEIDNLNFSKTNDVFKVQNQTWSALTGDSRKLYSEETNVNYTSHNPENSVTVNSNEKADSASGSTPSSSNGLTDTWKKLGMDSVFSDEGKERKITEDDNYISVDFIASYDGPYYLYDYGYVDSQYGSADKTLLYLGTYKKGDKVTAKLLLGDTIKKSILDATVKSTYIGCLNMELMKEYSEILNERDITIKKSVNNDSHLSGKFTASDHQKLFFTIPYDEGWKLYVDGNSVELNKSVGLFMSADASVGTHSYQLVYFPPGLKVGIIISVSSLALLVAWTMVLKRKSRG